MADSLIDGFKQENHSLVHAMRDVNNGVAEAEQLLRNEWRGDDVYGPYNARGLVDSANKILASHPDLPNRMQVLPNGFIQIDSPKYHMTVDGH
jgi:hypothetical protein